MGKTKIVLDADVVIEFKDANRLADLPKILERTFYSLKCDGCGKELEDEADEYARADDEEATGTLPGVRPKSFIV